MLFSMCWLNTVAQESSSSEKKGEPVLIFTGTKTSSTDAFDFTINGIYYKKLTNNICEVTYKENITYTTYKNGKITGTRSAKKSDYQGNVVIPANVTNNDITYQVKGIQSDAFRGCTELESVEIPSNISEIGSDAFSGCTGLTKVFIDDIVSWCKTSFGNEYASPLYYAKQLYSDENTEITKIVIPQKIDGLSEYAFCGLSNSCTIYAYSSNISTIKNRLTEQLLLLTTKHIAFQGQEHTAEVLILG